MKKLLILLFSASLFISCNNNKDQGGGGFNINNNGKGGWSSAEKNKFMSDCVNGGGNKQLCSCVLGKLQGKFKNMQEADRMGGEAAGQQLAMECQQGGGGNDNWNENNGGGGGEDSWDQDPKKGDKDDYNNRDGGNDNWNENGGGGNNNGGGGNWSGSDKNKFMNDCINGGGTRQLCSCVLGKLQQKFRNMDEADRVGGAAEGERLGQECRNLGNMQ